MKQQWKDPINLIITGVGGQGNILISKLIGEVLVKDGYQVTIGETYGASQRGGSVTSHIRISKSAQYGPVTPEGKADVILGLEPLESLRILALFGNPKTFVISNIRPIHPMSVSIGNAEYPDIETIKRASSELSKRAWYIDASKIAINLGVPLLTNMVMAGSLIGSGLLPLEKDKFERQLEIDFEKSKFVLNLKAFTMGVDEIKKAKLHNKTRLNKLK